MVFSLSSNHTLNVISYTVTWVNKPVRTGTTFPEVSLRCYSGRSNEFMIAPMVTLATQSQLFLCCKAERFARWVALILPKKALLMVICSCVLWLICSVLQTASVLFCESWFKNTSHHSILLLLGLCGESYCLCNTIEVGGIVGNDTSLTFLMSGFVRLCPGGEDWSFSWKDAVWVGSAEFNIYRLGVARRCTGDKRIWTNITCPGAVGGTWSEERLLRQPKNEDQISIEGEGINNQ